MLNYYKYRTPFNKPFKTALGEFKYREGLILTFETDDVIAFGETSPLPGFSNESLQEAEEILTLHKNFIKEALREESESKLNELLTLSKDLPSVTFGLETLFYDLASKKTGLPLHEFLFGTPFSPVPCNATIGMNSLAESLSQVEKATEEGFKTLKVKMGTDLNKEIDLIQRIRESYPSVKIRIDANQAWKQEEAIRNLELLSDLDIEYCEQPVSKEDLAGLKRVTDTSKVDIAADEAVRTLADLKRLTDTNSCDLIVLKPVLFGSYRDLTVTKKLLHTHDKELVLTTVFDGVIGRAMTAILASGLGSKKYAHGLATGSHLAEEYGHREITNGFFDLSASPGLGMPLSINNLKSFTCV